MDRKVIEKILSNLRNENNGTAVDHLISRISGMSQEEIDSYHQFDEFCPGKVVDVVDVDTFVI